MKLQHKSSRQTRHIHTHKLTSTTTTNVSIELLKAIDKFCQSVSQSVSQWLTTGGCRMYSQTVITSEYWIFKWMNERKTLIMNQIKKKKTKHFGEFQHISLFTHSLHTHKHN